MSCRHMGRVLCTGDQAKADGISLFTFPQAGYFDATMYSMLEQAGGMDFYNAALQYDGKHMDIRRGTEGSGYNRENWYLRTIHRKIQ